MTKYSNNKSADDRHRIEDFADDYGHNCAAPSEDSLPELDAQVAAAELQSEQQLEDALIAQLASLGYDMVDVTSEAQLIENLQTQLQAANDVQLSAAEFKQVLHYLQKPIGIFKKAHALRDRVPVKRDDGSTTYLRLLLDERHDESADEPSLNRFQVTRQVTMTGDYENRYDVTILVNGLPLVQIELKRSGIEMKQAFSQINRYRRHSFWAGAAFFQYVQLFVVSNGVHSKYFANARELRFEQSFYWAEKNSKRIGNLSDFTRAFLPPEHLGKMLSQYIVLNESQRSLMVLRPYQVYATEAIVERVQNPPAEKPNGYIWHTTGSGKTLTSFKTAQLLTKLPDVHKVVFCVDRKDLDTQTIDEFNAFKKDSVSGTDNTSLLVQQLKDDTSLIVTTIQKLNNAIHNPRYLRELGALKDQRVVFIFDECHRSQFGETHRRICEFFNNRQLFGFTGTPIFEDNAASVTFEKGEQKFTRKHTTQDLFHKRLHSYVITDAIKDENVLPFAVEYVGRYSQKDDAADTDVEAIDTREVLDSPERAEQVVDYILKVHGNKTHSRRYTAMFCVSSVPMLIQTMDLFRAKRAAGEHDLTVATIFSYQANQAGVSAPEDMEGRKAEIDDGILDDDVNLEAGDGGNPHYREKLDTYISEYNQQFGTAFSTKDSKKFYNYYKDIAKRLKAKPDVKVPKQRVDILLVVNMFLTGFDSKYVNTMYVDKNLKQHGLIQAYSRTNRILGPKKSQGNIVVFRNLKKATDEAVQLFSNKQASEIIFVPPYDEYVAEFNELVPELTKLVPRPADVLHLASEQAQLQFVQLFRRLLRLHNVLSSFAEFDVNDLHLTPQRFAEYRSAYLDLFDKVDKDHAAEKVSILDDVDFELELLHRDVINVDYILKLLVQLRDAKEEDQPQLRQQILDAVSGDEELRSKRELIAKFIDEQLPNVPNSVMIPESFESFWEHERDDAFAALVKEEQLDADKLQEVINRYVYTGQQPLPDPDIMNLLTYKPKIVQRKPTRERVYERVMDYVDTFGLLEA